MGKTVSKWCARAEGWLKRRVSHLLLAPHLWASLIRFTTNKISLTPHLNFLAPHINFPVASSNRSEARQKIRASPICKFSARACGSISINDIFPHLLCSSVISLFMSVTLSAQNRVCRSFWPCLAIEKICWKHFWKTYSIIFHFACFFLSVNLSIIHLCLLNEGRGGLRGRAWSGCRLAQGWYSNIHL